jgi:hypothetical protein
LNKNSFKKTEEISIVSSRLLQRGRDMIELMIREKRVEQYDKIPPEFVIQRAIEAKDKFDELVVLYPDQKILEATPVFDDPLLC